MGAPGIQKSPVAAPVRNAEKPAGILQIFPLLCRHEPAAQIQRIDPLFFPGMTQIYRRPLQETVIKDQVKVTRFEEPKGLSLI